jgi:2-polyprenyl-3-methyl-5-hydroxy-6-metoxy-1,4-benzoquinol methylase
MEQDDYFSNHAVGHRWPFSLYHDSIARVTYSLIEGVRPPGVVRCLNVGCGFFHAYPQWKSLGRWEACDVDARCLEVVSRRYPEVGVAVCGSVPEYPAASFDIVVATEVIEHIEDPVPWLRHVLGLVRDGGVAVFSTPNYLSLLPVVEYTLLQAVALAKGFSRFSIHPNKYHPAKLRRHLEQAAPPGASVTVKKCAYSMALVGSVRLAP